MTAVFYVPNPHFAEDLVRDTFVKLLLAELAEQGAELYKDGVPVDEGDLRESVFGVVALTPEGFRGRIGATDWKASLVELGTILHSPDGSLRRAIEAIGLSFEETRT